MAVTVPVAVGAMRLADISAVHEIERLSFTTPWPAYAFEQELTANRLARYVVARVGDRVVGFGGVWLMVDEAHVTTIGVHPDWRRQGVGRRLLVALIDLADELRATRVTLEVRAGNEGAQALYAELGFEATGRRVRYYSDDGEDALVMTTPRLSSPAMRDRVARARRQTGPVEPADAERSG
jgi:ribosomal-protein-alanine N-acetyltransferase